MMKILNPDIPGGLTPITSTDILHRERRVSGGLIETIDLAGQKLKNISIHESKITKSDLSQTMIENLKVQDCIIEDCNLTASVFTESNWHTAHMLKARASGIKLQSSVIKNVLFKNCKLDFANFRLARLENVIFEDCVINELDFYNAVLKNVDFVNSAVEDVEFSEAKLQNVNLTRSQIISIKGLRGLKGAAVSQVQLIQLLPYLAHQIGLIIKD